MLRYAFKTQVQRFTDLTALLSNYQNSLVNNYRPITF